MNNEIKEILDYLSGNDYVRLDDNRNYKLLQDNEDKILLDYITNLQEELKSANESITWWTNRFNAVEKENKKLNKQLEMLFKKEYPFIVENGIICMKNKEIENLQEELKYQKQAEQEYNEKHTKLMKKYKELQQENKELNRMCELYSKSLYNAELTDYKSRIDKAIEYINKLQENDDIEIWRENGYWAYILNILNGGDSNE